MRGACAIFLMGWLALGLGRAQLSTVTMFSGQGSQATAFFTTADKWEVQWQCPDLVAITVLAPDGSAVAGASGTGNGTLYLDKGGKYYLQVTRAGSSKDPWRLSIFQVGSTTRVADALTSASAPAPVVATSPVASSTPAASTNAAPSGH